MADIPYMDEERHAEQARQSALAALYGQQKPAAEVVDQEITPQQLRDEKFSKSPFGALDRTLKAGTDWIKGKVAKRRAPFAGVEQDMPPGAGLPSPVELLPTMMLEGGRTANRWLYGTKDPTQLRDEDMLGPFLASTMTAPFAALKHGASLGSAGGKLAASQSPQPFSRQVDDLGYYSKLDEVLGSLRPTDTVTMDTLAKRGVKAAEIEARGLSPFMADGKGAKVGDLQGGAQPAQVKESRYQDSSIWDDEAEGMFGSRYRDLGTAERETIDDMLSGPPPPGPKWRDYATDGDNPSYHEGVLHLPTKRDDIKKRLDEVRNAEEALTNKVRGGGTLGEAEVARLNELRAEAVSLHEKDKGLRGQDFRSGHWDEPNAIAHYRASMQPTEGGGKAYLIDELQSDWGQKLRDGGVRDEAKIGELRTRFTEADEAYTKAAAERAHRRVRDPSWDDAMDATNKAEVEKLFAQKNLLDAELRTAEAATPGNPFVNTSEQWMTTALRRMMRNAAEQEADGIAITPGAVHNERFGLEKHFRKVEYNPSTNELLSHRADVSGERPVVTKVPPEKLAEHVGAETAEKLLATTPDGEGYHALSGLDLRMGGEGMKYAYDKILPKLLGKELSKLDPSIKYGQRKIAPSEWDGPLDAASFEGKPLSAQPFYENPFHHFPLTPKAREEIMKGLPLFNAPGGPEAIMEALRANQQLQGPFAEE